MVSVDSALKMGALTFAAFLLIQGPSWESLDP